MDRFIPAQQACVRYLASERSLELHARRGNLPFRGQEGARLYDAEVLPLLFRPRSAASATLPAAGTLGALCLGGSLADGTTHAERESALRRRRRVTLALDAAPLTRPQREAQEA